MKRCLKTENSCLKTQTKHLLNNLEKKGHLLLLLFLRKGTYCFLKSNANTIFFQSVKVGITFIMYQPVKHFFQKK